MNRKIPESKTTAEAKSAVRNLVVQSNNFEGSFGSVPAEFIPLLMDADYITCRRRP
jgi:hypothetical protein